MKWLFACVAIALLVPDVELRVPRRRRPSYADNLAEVFPSDFLCAPPNESVDVQQGETEVNSGTEVCPYDLVDPPTITLTTDDDCFYALIIVCAYESSLNETDTSEDCPDEESGYYAEEDCVNTEEGEPEEEPEEVSEEESPEYGYDYETLVACTNLDSSLDLSDCELPYRPPTLTPGAGTKQCIIVVYAQEQEIDEGQAADICRTGVSPCQFRDDNCLPDPIAANWYSICDIAESAN